MLITAIDNEKGSIKFGCEKIVRLVSEKKPELVYPYFDFLVKFLDSENNFIKWGAVVSLSNLCRVDSKKQFEKIFNKYYAPITGPIMVTAVNIVGNSWKIAQAKPELIDRIVEEILKIEKAKYEYKGELSPECNNVVCGHAIESFDKIFEKIKNQKKIMAFVKRQLNNSRPSVRKRAEKFMKKWFH